MFSVMIGKMCKQVSDYFCKDKPIELNKIKSELYVHIDFVKDGKYNREKEVLYDMVDDIYFALELKQTEGDQDRISQNNISISDILNVLVSNKDNQEIMQKWPYELLSIKKRADSRI